MSKKGKNGILGASPHAENGQESGEVEIVVNSTQKKEPFGTPFQPGQSGNPGGRPKTSDLKAEVREFADEEDPKLRKTRLRQWLEMADRRARQGSPKHLEMLLAYGWGRPSQAIELDAKFSYTDEITKMRERREGRALPAATPGNGHSDAQTAQAAAAMPDQDLTGARDDDAERPADAPQPQQKIRVEL
jgi:hypothetical protein